MRKSSCMAAVAAAAVVTLVAPALATAQEAAAGAAIPVTVKNFARAESDMYFGNVVKQVGVGRFVHNRAPTPIEKQEVVRMNRDTLYSSAVFDLDAGPATITLPDPGKRFMSMQTVTEDHYSPPTAYAPGSVTLTRDAIGTRYVMVIVRTLADPLDAADLKAANALQDAIKVEQPGGPGSFQVPDWDKASQGEVRNLLSALQARSGVTNEVRMGTKDEVDPVFHLLATATGWGLNPPKDAVYVGGYPQPADGKTVMRLTVKDVPVDGFWSISVYDDKGFFQKNDLDSYSLNSITAKPNKDGSYTIQFGGCTKTTPNCLVTPVGWNYIVRLYRPRAGILDGSWRFPEPQPVG
jgi:hypothetical protein